MWVSQLFKTQGFFLSVRLRVAWQMLLPGPALNPHALLVGNGEAYGEGPLSKWWPVLRLPVPLSSLFLVEQCVTS